MPKLAANLSFMFKDRDFLDRFSAAAACGKAHTISRTEASLLVDEKLPKFINLSVSSSLIVRLSNLHIQASEVLSLVQKSPVNGQKNS